MRSLLILLVLLSTGCSTTLGDFTLLSSKNVEISRVDLKEISIQKNIDGSDGRFWFLFIPFGAPPSLELAVDEALENGQGDFMTSAVLYRTSWSILVFSWESYSVYGDVGNSIGEGSRNIEGAGGSKKFDPIPDY